jgi:hypothetical protein
MMKKMLVAIGCCDFSDIGVLAQTDRTAEEIRGLSAPETVFRKLY